jgi:hypothetical protein
LHEERRKNRPREELRALESGRDSTVALTVLVLVNSREGRDAGRHGAGDRLVVWR